MKGGLANWHMPRKGTKMKNTKLSKMTDNDKINHKKEQQRAFIMEKRKKMKEDFEAKKSTNEMSTKSSFSQLQEFIKTGISHVEDENGMRNNLYILDNHFMTAWTDEERTQLLNAQDAYNIFLTNRDCKEKEFIIALKRQCKYKFSPKVAGSMWNRFKNLDWIPEKCKKYQTFKKDWSEKISA